MSEHFVPCDLQQGLLHERLIGMEISRPNFNWVGSRYQIRETGLDALRYQLFFIATWNFCIQVLNSSSCPSQFLTKSSAAVKPVKKH